MAYFNSQKILCCDTISIRSEKMKTRYVQNVKVLSSMTDAKAEMGLAHTLSYLQDNMCEFFKALGCDGITMIPIAKCFWVMTKTKVKFNSTVKWMDNIVLETGLSKKTSARLNIYNNILDTSGNMIVEGMQEICAVDSETRKLRLVSTTALPEDIEVDEDKIPTTNFTKFEEELDESYLRKNYIVDSRSIDFFGHTNNVEYARIMFSTFTGIEVNSLVPREFEIHYIAESREGDNLLVYRKDDGDSHYFEIKCGERVISKALLVVD